MKKIISLIILSAILTAVCVVGLSGCDSTETSGADVSSTIISGNPNTGLIESRYDNSDYNRDDVSNTVSNFGNESNSSEDDSTESDTTSNNASDTSSLKIGENEFVDSW